MDKSEYLEKYCIAMGLIRETEAKANLLLFKMDEGKEITEGEVEQLERDTIYFLNYLEEIEATCDKT